MKKQCDRGANIRKVITEQNKERRKMGVNRLLIHVLLTKSRTQSVHKNENNNKQTSGIKRIPGNQ